MTTLDSTLAEVMAYSDPLPEAAAAAKGLVVVLPEDNELFLDLDSLESRDVFHAHLNILQGRLPGLVQEVVSNVSASGGDHRHVTITLSRPVKGAVERILLQAVLGSDLRRELLSFAFLEKGRECPTLFFERPEVTPAPFDTELAQAGALDIEAAQ